MKTLVAVTLFTNAKNYVLREFCECMRACVDCSDDVLVLVIGDHPLPQFAHMPMELPGHYAEDMLTASRELAFNIARGESVDKLVLQGVDALWQKPQDFRYVLESGYDVVAPLISARMDPKYLIARTFDRDDDEVFPTQHNIKRRPELPFQRIDGFPGADNIVIDRRALGVPFEQGHRPWYARVAAGETNVCVEEEWCRRAVQAGYGIWLCNDVRVWHVHETGPTGEPTANMYDGISMPLRELTWEPIRSQR